jgi:hypothetical protein
MRSSPPYAADAQRESPLLIPRNQQRRYFRSLRVIAWSLVFGAIALGCVAYLLVEQYRLGLGELFDSRFLPRLVAVFLGSAAAAYFGVFWLLRWFRWERDSGVGTIRTFLRRRPR